MVKAECQRLGIDRADLRFSRRDVRQYTGWGNTQLGVHLRRLQELEYLVVHRGGRGQSFVYELAFEHQDAKDKPMLPGLIDLDTLEHVYDEKYTGQNGNPTGSKRPQNGGITGTVREEESPVLTEDNGSSGLPPGKITTEERRKTAS